MNAKLKDKDTELDYSELDVFEDGLTLTARQHQVVAMFAEGFPAKIIGSHLKTSTANVYSMINNARKKNKLPDTDQLLHAYRAARNGETTPTPHRETTPTPHNDSIFTQFDINVVPPPAKYRRSKYAELNHKIRFNPGKWLRFRFPNKKLATNARIHLNKFTKTLGQAEITVVPVSRDTDEHWLYVKVEPKK